MNVSGAPTNVTCPTTGPMERSSSSFLMAARLMSRERRVGHALFHERTVLPAGQAVRLEQVPGLHARRLPRLLGGAAGLLRLARSLVGHGQVLGEERRARALLQPLERGVGGDANVLRGVVLLEAPQLGGGPLRGLAPVGTRAELA